MKEEKISKLIKDIRKKYHLTQKDLADKYHVTYQAVSKWETGKSIPDISILNEICKDYNISLDDTIGNTKKNNTISIILFCFGIVLFIMGVYVLKNTSNNFEFKTITTTCTNFNITGSLAYNYNKSSIYISNINYCGGDNTEVYQSISCSLYENDNNVTTLIEKLPESNNITIENYLKNLEIKVDNYTQKCKYYKDNSLYLEINLVDSNNEEIIYKVPLTLNDNCN